MKVKFTSNLKIRMKNEDAETLKSALNKIRDESKKIGFNNNFLSVEEYDVLNKLTNLLIQ